MMPRTKTRTGTPPDTYFECIRRFPLASIRSETELDEAQAVVDDLLAGELDAGERMYLDALSDLVIHYEQEHHPVPPLPPHELLAGMLAERGMTQADLVRATGLAKATVSDLVGGRRGFTWQQMKIVGSALGLPGKLFLPPM
jgi:HTH-type transcriptional regulator / antitoxin HigA